MPLLILAAAAAAGLCSGRPAGACLLRRASGGANAAKHDKLGRRPGSGPSASEPNLAPVTLTPQRMQSIGVKTGVVEFRPVRDEIRTVGNVEADETRISDVQIRFAGWVQKVYADAMYKQVRQGQPLLTIYSPELVTAEQEYLVAKELLAQTHRSGSCCRIPRIPVAVVCGDRTVEAVADPGQRDRPAEEEREDQA